MEQDKEMIEKEAGHSPQEYSLVSDIKKEPVDDSLVDVIGPEFVEVKSENVGIDEPEWDGILKKEPVCDASQEEHTTVKPYPTDYILQGVTNSVVKMEKSDVDYEIKSEELVDENMDSESYDIELDKSTILASRTSSADHHPSFAEIRKLQKHEKSMVTSNSKRNALCADGSEEDVDSNNRVRETCEGASFPLKEAKVGKEKESGLEEADQDFREEENWSHERANGKQTRRTKQKGTVSSAEVSTEKHRRKKGSKVPFQCETCGKSFAFHNDFEKHRRVHTGDKPFQCSVCQKAFAQKGGLVVHMRMHSGEKPFECQLCRKGLRSKSDLARHVRTHTGERPYKCTVCGKTFTQRSKLAAHMRIHHSEEEPTRPFACSVCGLQFFQQNHLSKHRRIDH